MSDTTVRFDPESVREQWDRAADAFVEGQTSGRDYYRLDFLGPAQVAACGEVRGARLLDVGCGGGYLARELAMRGARVTGIDISPRMIEHARRLEADAPLGVDYHVGDAAEIAAHFPAESFDAAASCLALQDMPDPAAALRAVHAVLRPGAHFVASITHPCTDTPFRAWERDAAGQKRWLCVDRYFERVPIEFEWQRWAYRFTTAALHVPLEDWFGWTFAAGFQLRAFYEPRPTDEALRRQPELEDATRMPYFIVLDLVRA